MYYISYEGELTRIEIIKIYNNLEVIGQASILSKHNHVKLAQKEDVIKINSFFKIPPDVEQFYTDIQNENRNRNHPEKTSFRNGTFI